MICGSNAGEARWSRRPQEAMSCYRKTTASGDRLYCDHVRDALRFRFVLQLFTNVAREDAEVALSIGQSRAKGQEPIGRSRNLPRLENRILMSLRILPQHRSVP